jgi:AcrR family transcriptional regulator
MRKGERTRGAILDTSVRLASELGLEGLTIGRLAEALDLSKSGLFAHFQSKEALQVETLERAADRFRERVVRPGLAAPRGEPRVRELFERWMRWAGTARVPAGCIFVAAAAELDDRPGVARDRLVSLQEEWLATLAGAARRAVEAGHFRRDLDPELFAFELQGIALSYHHQSRLLREPRAGERARAAFDRLLADARAS